MELKYDKPIDKEKFKEYTNLDLNEKIKLSKEIIKEFYENISKNENEKIFISSSFGKDSIVLIDLVRSIYPDIPIIHSDTGLELKGVYETKKLYDNVLTVYPTKNMEKVIEEDGYILPIGKSKTMALERSRNFIKNEKWDNFSFKLLTGRTKSGKKGLYNYSNCAEYIFCPFKISVKCDYFLKKKPLDDFKKENHFKYYFNGITYDEGIMRKTNLMKQGFNQMGSHSRPLGHWNENDVWEYIYINDLPYGDYYGDIIKGTDGKYTNTLFKRNGCICCPCGSHLEKEPNRYQLLYSYDYDAWKYVIYELNFKKVLDYFEVPYYPNEITSDQDDLNKYFNL